MNTFLIPLGYALSGFLMKLSDDAFDEKQDKKFAMISGIICGILIGFLVVESVDATYIFFGIFLGTLFSRKIDGMHHILTMIAFLAITFIFGIGEIEILPLLICSLSAYLDEIGNDNLKISEKSRYLEFFFRYRFTMKIAILILSLLGLWGIITGNGVYGLNGLSPWTIVYFILFEISYELAGHLFDGIYNRFHSTSRII
ncbi:hypothetical protein [Methanobacterium alcaliphilum]|uniref:hypothetical protein n=1 Tax=Methanobacterium alcaliphilum TaxID=392018 RepID=UPI002009E444|nr:hypothetical protein [Methanobacterium alcaliphilum]MCK9152403.1 hypothetical protein [Methanobacterium alcaliphilum]